MATYSIKDMFRPKVAPASGGDAGVQSDADFIDVTVMRDGDGATKKVRLDFATYTGLEAEWEAGTSTTNLQAALAAEFTAIEDPHLTTAQKSFKTTYAPVQA